MAKKLNDGHQPELLDRIHVVSMILEDHCVMHPAAIENKKVTSALERALAELAEAYQSVGAKMVSPKKKKKATQFSKLQGKVLDRFNNIQYSNGDISDIGNEIGFALGEELGNRQNLTDFLHGLNHGISLLDRIKKSKNSKKNPK